MRWIRSFGAGEAEGGRDDASLLGGKGAQLAEMTRLGLNVPPGFTITTEACRVWLATGEEPDGLQGELARALALVESRTGRTFGDSMSEPLLLSVRSGAPVSMPGMMDTVLNVGLNDASVEALARTSGDEGFAWDCYRRFVQMYGEVVAGVDRGLFEKEVPRAATDGPPSGEELRARVRSFKAVVSELSKRPFPEEPVAQLRDAVAAVFRSWRNERAKEYRRVHGIADDLGTAANVMAMVYGNRGEPSGSGVAFTRNPADGGPGLFGEFIEGAQGEDLVSGTRDPIPLDAFLERHPDIGIELDDLREILERHYADMQDMEFTVDRGTVWVLQTRTGKRTPRAAVRIAVDMVDEGLIEVETALSRVDAGSLDRLLHPVVAPTARGDEIGRGLPASPGAAAGRAVFTSSAARELASRNEPAVLVRTETSADDFPGMVAAQGIVTSRGGMTSHAAVVARGLGKCCIVQASSLEIDEVARSARCNGHLVREGDWLTLDGTDGRILRGRMPTVEPEPGEAFHRLLAWADGVRRLGVRANADDPADAARARRFGAEGIGLCRVEHMLLEEGRLDVMREMILAEDDGTRRSALDRLESVLRSDLREVFGAMDGLPVTVRLLDPPLHEFLPREGPDLARLARISGRSREEVLASVERHRESNPMLGRRGVRLGIAFPEISRMQARAIFDGALDATAEGTRVRLEIMIPLVMSEQEVARQRGVVETVAESVFSARGTRLPYAVGTMVELPRAALVAAALAKRADFFSFGTNDLTQTTLGLSRDDAGGFLPLYVEEGYLVADPFRTLDLEGVGRLVRMAVHQGRRARKGLEMGVCGEHAGDPRSIDFFHGVGVDYLSCSPYRVPVARLAAAQAALQRGAEASAGRMPDEEALREPAARRTSSTAEEGVGAW